MLRVIRQILMYVVLLATLLVSMYLFVAGNNWGGFGTGLLLLLELFVIGLASAVAREFGERALQDTERENYARGYESGLRDAKKGCERCE